MVKNISVALISGGIDSATAAALSIESGYSVIGLSFDYGQRHKKELNAALTIGKHLKLKEHKILSIDLSAWGGSSLTDINQIIPTNGVQPGIIPSTYVPGRNTIFIAVALSLAEARDANQIVLGINAMDYSGYPDCRPDYLEAYQKLANLSNKVGREKKPIKLWAPLIKMNKVNIFQEAIRLKIPIEATWSCYTSNSKACGKCDSCRIRIKALEKLGIYS